MCGRISFSLHRAELLATYAWLKDAPEEVARYNIAPTDPVLTVGPDRADVVRWGIEGSKGGLFNLRAETAITKPYYQRMLLGRRVIVPASHFYEWRTLGGDACPWPFPARTVRSSILQGSSGAGKGSPRRPS
jgi:putative SOS response-associated peptidase YedK